MATNKQANCACFALNIHFSSHTFTSTETAKQSSLGQALLAADNRTRINLLYNININININITSDKG
jgi:hypothetical protein